MGKTNKRENLQSNDLQIDNDKSSELIKLLNRYREWMRSHGFSPGTVKNQYHNISYFITWCHDRGFWHPREITSGIIERYQVHLYRSRQKSGEPLSMGYQHKQLSNLRSFFKWMFKSKYMAYNPASDIELPRVEQRLPRDILTISEVERVFQQVDLSSKFGVRDRAILEVLYSTGMRRQELCLLKCVDLDFARGTVLVRHGKGKKDRVIPIGERALAWVEKYLNELRFMLVNEPDNGILFLNNIGNGLSVNWLSAAVTRFINAAKLNKTGSCHLFRHSMATLMLEGGADIRYIQQMLGHAKLNTTQLYTRVSIKKLKEVHKKTHPGAQLKRKRK